MKIQCKSLESLRKTGDIYQLEVGDMSVVMVYSENTKCFKECLLSILKQKLKEV